MLDDFLRALECPSEGMGNILASRARSVHAGRTQSQDSEGYWLMKSAEILHSVDLATEFLSSANLVFSAVYIRIQWDGYLVKSSFPRIHVPD